MSQVEAAGSEVRAARVGRVLSMVRARRIAGDEAGVESVLLRYPDIACEVRGHLGVIGVVQGAAESVEVLLRQGRVQPATHEGFAARLGPYHITEVIGRGGMGIVLKALDERLCRTVALKILRGDLLADPVSIKRFRREARAAADIRHPSVVTVFEIGEAANEHFIAMEYVEGETLANLIRQTGAISTEVARAMFEQLLDGLSAAHRLGLIHRDIKPSNLIVNGFFDVVAKGTGALRLKIADFGLARLRDAETRLTLTLQTCGTPEYMSPEQARGDADLDARSDLYSAGAVLYEMLTGQSPCRADSPAASLHKVMQVPPTEPRSVRSDADAALSSLAVRLLAKRREDRLESAEAARAVLDAKRSVTCRENWRRRGWKATVCLMAVAAVSAVVWGSRLVAPAATRPKKLIAARSHSDEYLEVMFDDRGQWELLHSFSKPVCVHGAAVANVDGQGDCIALAAINPPENGDCLIAFENTGRERWRLNLTSSRQWPDCEMPKGFGAVQVLAYPLDGTPGDELIVVASDINEYPTRVSILDPRSNPPRMLGTFWNLGDIGPNDLEGTRVQVVERFLEDKRPAILIDGMNNKLDGFESLGAMTPQYWTKWNVVSVVMVLDPVEIMRLGECVGPPTTDFINIPRGGVYSYAFVDMSADNALSTAEHAPGRRMPSPLEQGTIQNALVSGAGLNDGSGPGFMVQLQSGASAGGITMHLDRDLNIKIAIKSPSPPGLSESEWRSRWIPVVQGRRWLEPRGAGSRP